jgi:hypothetical protein
MPEIVPHFFPSQAILPTELGVRVKLFLVSHLGAQSPDWQPSRDSGRMVRFAVICRYQGLPLIDGGPSRTVRDISRQRQHPLCLNS